MSSLESAPVTREAKHRRIDLPERGVELNLLDWGGDGPLALLSHANGFCAAMWEPLAKTLRKNFRVLAFDARGHGDSTKLWEREAYSWDQFVEDLIAISERLTREYELARVEFAIGHSFGGSATLVAAAQRPDLFGRIAMLDPVVVPPPELLQLFPRDGSARILGKIARKRRNLWPSREVVRESWQEREPFRSWDSRAFDLYLSEGLRERADGQVELKCPGEIEAMIYETHSRPDTFGAAKKLRQPALLVWASGGDFPLAWYQKLADSASQMRLVEFDANHLLPMVAPDRVAELLLRFGSEA